MKNTIIIVLSVLLATLVGSAIWLFSTGRVVYLQDSSFAASIQKMASAKVVCNEKAVDTYNDAMYYKDRGGEGVSLDKKALSNLATDISGRQGVDDDPTCQTIILGAAIENGDADAAKRAYANLTRLHDLRIFTDSNIRDSEPLSVYSDIISDLSGENETDRAGGYGN